MKKEFTYDSLATATSEYRVSKRIVTFQIPGDNVLPQFVYADLGGHDLVAVCTNGWVTMTCELAESIKLLELARSAALEAFADYTPSATLEDIDIALALSANIEFLDVIIQEMRAFNRLEVHPQFGLDGYDVLLDGEIRATVHPIDGEDAGRFYCVNLVDENGEIDWDMRNMDFYSSKELAKRKAVEMITSRLAC